MYIYIYIYIYRERERERVDVDLARVRTLLLQFGRRACHELLCIAIRLLSLLAITIHLLSNHHLLQSNYCPIMRTSLGFMSDREPLQSESGPLRAVHSSRHKWPGGFVNFGCRTVESTHLLNA